MEHFVTLLDKNFLPQLLAMNASLGRTASLYRLWVVCMDLAVEGHLRELAPPNLVLIPFSSISTEALIGARDARSPVEFYWTVTPFAAQAVFSADDSVGRATYIDADLWFRRDPRVILDEFAVSGKTVLITEHAYSPEYDHAATSGRFCVQFMTFVRGAGDPVARWWQDRCLEWCFDRVEDGKFGDQKYLDDWPTRFGSLVHVLSRPELTLAPWNAQRFPYSDSVFFHFHGLKIAGRKRVEIGHADIPTPVLQNIYGPYLEDLATALLLMDAHGIPIPRQTPRRNAYRRVRNWMRPYYREWRRRRRTMRIP